MRQGQQLDRLADWLVLASGRQRWFAAFAAGLLSALATPPLDLFPVLFFTLPILVWIMDGVHSDGRSGVGANFLGAFAPGWWFGFGYCLASLWWIGNSLLVEAESFAWALPLAILGVPAGLAVFFGLGTAIARVLWFEGPFRVLALTSGFAISEFLRGEVLTGFPWNLLGQAAMPVPVAMQVISVLGLYGVNALAILVFAIPLTVLAKGNSATASGRLLLLLCLALAGWQAGYGFWRLGNVAQEIELRGGEAPLRVRLVQPDIPQREKFRPEKEAEFMAEYLRLSAKPEKVDYVIWPESAFPFLLTERRDMLAAIARMLPDGTELITGGLRAEPGAGGDPYGHVYNSVYLINDAGEIYDAADKVHLVPFGEYLPLQSWLESLGLRQLTGVRGGFEAASERRLMQGARGGPFITLVCYEIIFPGEIRPPRADDRYRAKWLLNLTNDAWFGNTPGPYQHLRLARLRAVEEGLPLVRVANTGISAVVDAHGREVVRIGLSQRGSADAEIPQQAVATTFARYGNLLFLVLAGMLVLGSLVFKWLNYRKDRA
jgi:apolipoprotein N-acyltransferase